jgi:GWxTD domain-containing protein
MGSFQGYLVLLRRLVGVLLVALTGSLLSACGSTTPLESQQAGKTISYVPGLPNFDMELVPSVREGRSGVDLNVGILYRSLIYVRRGDVYRSDLELTAQIFDGTGEYIVETVDWTDSLVVSDHEQTQSFELFRLRRRIDLPSGEYLCRVVLRDVNSNKQVARFQRLSVPEFDQEKPLFGHLFVERVREGVYEPVVSLHVPSNPDTLRAVTELYNADPYDEIEVQLAVVRFHTDGEVADPPFWITPYAGSLEYEGVDYNERDTVSSSRYTLESLSDQVQLKFRLPELERGVYRVDLTANLRQVRSAADSVVLTRQRELSVKGADFPTVTELDEVIEALTYIARNRELSQIRETEDPVEKRRLFDAFWGELVGQREEAKRLLRTYYSRVEEANLFFTSHKEGWKTDRGMVYIVMGAPLYVERYFDAEIWYYSYRENADDRFVFERASRYSPDEGVRFNNYLLLRRPYYERTWRRAIRRWREGEVL